MESKDEVGIGIFFITLILGSVIRGILNLIQKPSHNETRVKGELYAVTVFLFSIGRYSPGGKWYEYSFLKKNGHWVYKINKFSILVGIIIYAVMAAIIGFCCLKAENGYTFFIHIVPYMGIAFLAGGLVGPLSAYRYVLKMEQKNKKR